MKHFTLKDLKECRDNIDWNAWETIVDFITMFDFYINEVRPLQQKKKR